MEAPSYFPVALAVWQHPGDPHARLEALLEAAELAALPRRQVDLARLALRAEEYLVVPETIRRISFLFF